MDRPEDVEPHPRTGKVYAALTNNDRRGAGGAAADGPNPRSANKHGHVLELAEDGDDPAATTFRWPDGPGSQPRPSVVSIWKTGPDGPGLIGS